MTTHYQPAMFTPQGVMSVSGYAITSPTQEEHTLLDLLDLLDLFDAGAIPGRTPSWWRDYD